MNINLVFYNTFDNRNFFELTEGKRPWSTFLIIKKGSFEYQLNDKLYTVTENEIAFFPPDVTFKRKIINPISFHQFAFFTDKNNQYYNSLKSPLLSIPKPHVLSIIETLDKIKDFTENSDVYINTIENIIYQNFIHSKSNFNNDKKIPKDLLLVVNYMAENIDKKISIPNLAKIINLTNVGFIWKFKKHFKVTPSNYLINLRMNLAKKLLLDGTLSIKEIAEHCGYENTSYFSNAFYKYYKTRPSNF